SRGGTSICRSDRQPRPSGGSSSRSGSSSTTRPPCCTWGTSARCSARRAERAGGRIEGRRYDAPVKAVVMAGGQGTRLRPLTSNQPKPMLPIVGQPMLHHILRLLRASGFTDVVVTVQFL